MKRAIVEIHDVTPYYGGEFLRILGLLNALDIEKFSLLVVPNFWETYPVNGDLVLLRALKGSGGEILLHGYTHQGEPSLINKIWTDAEGEFSRLSLEETDRRIREGQELFNSLGLSCEFFVPPAWLGNPYLNKVLHQNGFKGAGYRGLIKFFSKRVRVFAPVLGFSNRKFFSEISLRAFPLGERILERFPVVRLAIHCADFRCREKVQLWEQVLTRIKGKRRLTTYGELFNES